MEIDTEDQYFDSEKESWSEEELENEVELSLDFQEEVVEEEEEDCEGDYMSPWENSSGSDRDSRSEDEGESNDSDSNSGNGEDESSSVSEDESSENDSVVVDDDESDDELSEYLELRRRVRCNEYGGMIALASFLAKPDCSLETLDLERADYLEDNDAFILASGLERNKSLRTLSLAGSYSEISVKGWGAIFSQLHSSKLEELSLNSCGLDDDTANSLAHALMIGTNLKKLELSNNRTITIEGWKAIFSTLSHCNLRGLQELSIGCQHGNGRVASGFTDEEMTFLASGLANNCTLKRLWLRMCLNHNGPQGWGALASILRNPRSALEDLDFAFSESFNNDALALVADSLRYNNKLKEMNLEWSGWDEDDLHELPRVTDCTPLSAVLCDGTSIEATFNSNHSLERLTEDSWSEILLRNLAPDLLKSLHLNRNLGPVEAARRKIINIHFSGCNFSMDPFIDMDTRVLPQVIAWMAKDDYGKSVLYQFIKNSCLFA